MEFKGYVQKVDTVQDEDGVTRQVVDVSILLLPVEFKGLVAAMSEQGEVILQLKK